MSIKNRGCVSMCINEHESRICIFMLNRPSFNINYTHTTITHTQWCSLAFCSEYTVLFSPPSLIRTHPRATPHGTTTLTNA